MFRSDFLLFILRWSVSVGLWCFLLNIILLRLIDWLFKQLEVWSLFYWWLICWIIFFFYFIDCLSLSVRIKFLFCFFLWNLIKNIELLFRDLDFLFDSLFYFKCRFRVWGFFIFLIIFHLIRIFFSYKSLLFLDFKLRILMLILFKFHFWCQKSWYFVLFLII